MADSIKAGEAFLELSVRDNKFKVGLSGALNTMKSFAGSLAVIGASLTTLGGTLTATFGIAAKTFSDVGDKLEKMSQRTGIGVETLSQIAYAAQQSGTDIASLEDTIKQMQRSLSGLS